MLRREVMKLGGSLFGLGAGTPSRFPYPGRPQPSPGVSPSPGIVVRANRVIVFGPAGTPVGVFVYQPGTTPAAGNPPIAWMTASTVDPFGNALPGGLQVGSQNTGHTQFAGLTTGQLALSGAATQFAPGLVQESANAVLTFNSGSQGLADNAAVVSFYSRLAAVAASLGTTALALFSELLFASSGLKVQGGATTDTLTATGQVTATGGTAASPTEVTTDTWHPVSVFGTGFAAGSPAPSYLLLPDQSVALRGQVAVTGAVASGAVMFTLPYTFPAGQGFTTPTNLSGFAAGNGTLTMNPSGTVTTRASGVNGNVVFLDNCRNWLI